MICKVSCERMELFKQLYLTVEEDGKPRMDFEKAVPMPDWVRDTEHSFQGRSHPCDWYEWRKRHWGVKWNAYDTELFEDQIQFMTPWNPPLNVMAEIAWQLGCDIHIDYADEDIGSNCASMEIHPDGTFDAVPMNQDESARMWGYRDFEDFKSTFDE